MLAGRLQVAIDPVDGLGFPEHPHAHVGEHVLDRCDRGGDQAPHALDDEAVCRAVAPYLRPETIILSVVKALFAQGPPLVSGVVAEELPGVVDRLAVLSGPNFAVEVARELPAGTVVASRDERVARTVQEILHTDRVRVWNTPDVTGVELGGALKNVIAIAAGLADGLGMGHNARAALITRG